MRSQTRGRPGSTSGQSPLVTAVNAFADASTFSARLRRRPARRFAPVRNRQEISCRMHIMSHRLAACWRAASPAALRSPPPRSAGNVAWSVSVGGPGFAVVGRAARLLAAAMARRTTAACARFRTIGPWYRPSSYAAPGRSAPVCRAYVYAAPARLRRAGVACAPAVRTRAGTPYCGYWRGLAVTAVADPVDRARVVVATPAASRPARPARPPGGPTRARPAASLRRTARSRSRCRSSSSVTSVTR